MARERQAAGSVRVGKRVRDTLYVHVSVRPFLLEPDARLLERACEALEGVAWNVARICRSGEVGLMLYEDFATSAFPALLRSAVVDLRTGATKSRDWSLVSSPPIIHRKELMLAPGFPGVGEFAALTSTLESLGVFAEPTRIGSRSAWERILADAGVKVEGHRVVGLMAAPDEDEASGPCP